ncbi:MAG: bifunctional DNA primase/polymerase [Pseudomonadota bacterium]|nr:bifunctional DNA primase/polymerase [Pseudomonadota bacterium]
MNLPPPIPEGLQDGDPNFSDYTNRFSMAARAGFRVIPLRPQSKVPALASWKEFQDRAPTAEELASWDQSDCNMGVICGAASNLVVVDVDSPEAQALLDGLSLPATPAVKTAKGQHLYFRPPPGGLRNGTKIAGEKLDLRGDGGYVVGAGSVHETGVSYQWLVSPDDVPFAEFPQQLLELIGADKKGASSRQHDLSGKIEDDGAGKFARYLHGAISGAASALGAAAEGERNDTLFREGVRVARHVAGAGEEWEIYASKLRSLALGIGLEAFETDRTLQSCWASGSLEPTPWMLTAREWVYLSKPDVFYHLTSRQHLKVPAFNNTFARQRVTKAPFSSFLLNGGYVSTFHDLEYRPASAERYIEKDGLTWLNTYRPSDVLPVAGDWSPFEDFITYLVPEEEERNHLLKMMAWTVRHPGQKLRHALLLRSEHQGVGKTMLTEIWTELLGPHNVRKTSTEEVSGQFQGFIKETLLVLLEELNWGVGPIGYNRLKDLITADVASVNEKFLPVRHWPNLATFVILTNLRTPIIVEDKDRRIFYIDTPAVPREKEYYASFANWWQLNLGVIRAFLDTVDLSAFNPFAPPPMTAAKRALIADSRTDLVKDLAIALEERCGVFNRDIVTLSEVETELGNSMRGKSKSQLREALRALGAQPFSQQRVPGKWDRGAFWESPERASLWAIRNTRYWEVAGAQARGEEFRRHEGLFAPFYGLPLAVVHISEYPGDPAELRVERTGGANDNDRDARAARPFQRLGV